jgi:hypothetical protein
MTSSEMPRFMPAGKTFEVSCDKSRRADLEGF